MEVLARDRDPPPFGIYVHVPFCRRKCAYCDFFSVAAEPAPSFIEALIRELHWRAEHQENFRPQRWPGGAVSLYFGGGTPSLLGPGAIDRVVREVNRIYGLGAGAEVTLEVNPATVDRVSLSGYRAAGVNRISLGVQSLDDLWLGRLNRLHTVKQALRAFADARATGFHNIGLDIILALPGQSLADCRHALVGATALGPEHLSVYLLSIEPGTPLAAAVRTGRFPDQDDDLAADALLLAADLLPRSGFRRYEISSYSIPGQEARHNRNYWKGGSYLGLGPGASSHHQTAEGGGARFANPPDLESYLSWWMAPGQIGSPPCANREVLGPERYFLERLYLGIRDIELGVDIAAVEMASGIGWWPDLEQAVDELVARGLLRREGSILRLTSPGAGLCDLVGRELLAVPTRRATCLSNNPL